jgi:hypothetical protein
MAASKESHTPKMSQRQTLMMHKIPRVLPHERVFPVQIGSEMFKLSGVSGAFLVHVLCDGCVFHLECSFQLPKLLFLLLLCIGL